MGLTETVVVGGSAAGVVAELQETFYFLQHKGNMGRVAASPANGSSQLVHLCPRLAAKGIFWGGRVHVSQGTFENRTSLLLSNGRGNARVVISLLKGSRDNEHSNPTLINHIPPRKVL